MSGCVVALALQRAADLGADRGGVVRERQELDAVRPSRAKRREQPLGLRLLAALIEPLEGDQCPGIDVAPAAQSFVSSASMSSSVWRRRITRHVAAVDSTSGGSGRRR